MKRPNAKQRRAFDDGAHARRGGIKLDRTLLIFGMPGSPDPLDLRGWAQSGWMAQKQRPLYRVNYSFYLNLIRSKVGGLNKQPRESKGNAMRTEEELSALKAEYQTVYDPYAEAEKAAGREPQPFDEAFNAHLEALDAEGTTGDTTQAGTGDDNAAGAADNGGDVAIEQAQAAEAAKATGAKATGKAKATPAPKATAKPKATPAPKAAKPKAFRPTGEDRKALNVAAAAALKAAKVEGTARMKPDSGTYSDFLSGKVLKLDADGNGSATLNVVTASAMETVVGKVDVTVKKGAMTAKGRKA